MSAVIVYGGVTTMFDGATPPTVTVAPASMS